MNSGALIILATGLIVGITAAALTGDPHWVQRMGAFMAASSAFFAVSEIKIQESGKREDVLPTGKQGGTTSLSAFRRMLAQRIVRVRLRTKLNAISERKVDLAYAHIWVACIGEFIHGFGDLIFIGFLNIIGSPLSGVH